MNLEEKVIENFKTICKIPRGSYDERKISDFLKAYAEERGFPVLQDKYMNLIISVPGTCGRENAPAVALQGHMDIVYVKTPDSGHIYEEGIETKVDGDFMTSTQHTSLGADDGFAVACCMTLMDDLTIPHPPLELLITVEEEVGLSGAKNLDCSSLKAKYFINLDSEQEGEFITSCAGGIRNIFTVPMGKKVENKDLAAYEINLTGLKGGHSGVDIDKGRGNAIKLLGRALKNSDSPYLHLASFSFNGKANAIPNACKAVIGIEKPFLRDTLSSLDEWFETIENELSFSDSPLFVIKEAEETMFYEQEAKERLLNALTLLPCGVLSKSFAIDGLIESSVNIGSCDEEDGCIKLLSSARSSVRSRKMAIVETIDTVADLLGCDSHCFSNYPQWDYNPTSHLRDLALKCYRDLSGKNGKTSAIHAGLECGYFHEKMPDCDMISMGCDIYDVHSPKERVSVSSFKRTWKLLLKILEEI